MPLYSGKRTPKGCVVKWQDRERAPNSVAIAGGHLPPRNDLFNHSPDGFEWGYGGSGPAQLALALIAFETGSDELAVRHHQAIKWAVVAHFTTNEWTLDGATIRNLIDRLESKDADD